MTNTKKKILLIDDDPSVSAALLMLLKDEFDTHAAGSVGEGVRLFESLNPSVVILDLHLPDKHGLDALRSIRRKDRNAPVIILTGFATLEVVEESMRLGASDCMHKPFNASALRSRLRELSQEKEVEAEDLFLDENERNTHTGGKNPDDLVSSAFLHDISNPITSMGAISAMLRDGVEDPKKRAKLASMIEQNVAYLSSLVDQWRAFAEPESLKDDHASISEIVEQAYGLVRLRSEAKGVSIELKLSNGDAQPLLNRHATVRILVNLLQNAIEAVPRETGKVIIRGSSEKGKVEFSIQDNGAGIEPEVCQKIFQARYTTKKKGSGLGLYIARRIIESASGSISICSRPGVGTSFIVQLPAS